MRILLIIIGTISLILGTVGMALPILPTTPFLLLSAACYIRSSRRLHDWLINHKIFGQYITEYKTCTMSVGKKVVTIALLWLGICFSIYTVQSVYIKLGLLMVAALVSVHISKR